MSKRPEPVMACAECGPVISGIASECPLCPGVKGHDVYWIDLAAGLEHNARLWNSDSLARLLTDAANRLREQDAQIEAMQQAQGGAKERHQGLKAARLATVIRDWNPHITARQIRQLRPDQWYGFVDEVNRRYGARHGRPSDETKALVAQKFAQPQEAGR